MKRIVIDSEVIPGDNTCQLCGRKFKAQRKAAKFCYSCHLEMTCSTCGKWINVRPSRSNTFKNCKSCSTRANTLANTKPGKCSKCGNFSETRSITGFCPSCKKNYYTSHNRKINESRQGFGPCIKCGKESLRNAAGLCSNCQPNAGSGICTRCGHLTKTRNAMGFCKKCANEQISTVRENNTKAGICAICGEYVTERNTFCMCKDCSNKHNLENLGFDREEFYFRHLELTTIY